MSRKTTKDELEFEDLSSYSSVSDYKKLKKGRSSVSAAVISVAVVCVLLIVAGSAMIYISTDLLAGLTTNPITKDPEKLGIASDTVLDESITNIAVFGVDARNDSFSGQSDVIMILTVDNKHEKLKMTSILRDTKVPIEGESLTGEYIDHWETKINAAYEEGGPELAIRTLNRNFGLNIYDYVTVNFSNMAAIVDAFDGVDVQLTAEEVREINRNLWNLSQEVLRQMEQDRADGTFEQHKYPSIVEDDYILDTNGELDLDSGNYVGGSYHLNGNQAVAYGRIRNIGDDYARVDRQQTVFSLLVKRLMEMGVVDYPGLIRDMMSYCETSFDLSGIVSLTPILTKDFHMESIKVPDIDYETDLYDGQAEDGIYYLEYDITSAAKRISSFIYEENSPYWEEYGDTGKGA